MNLMTHKVDHKTNTIFSVVAELCIITETATRSVAPSHARLAKAAKMADEQFRQRDDGDKLDCLVIDSVTKRESENNNNQHDIDIIVARGAAEP